MDWCASRGRLHTAERPYGSYFDELVDNLAIAYPASAQGITRVVVDRGELTLHVAREHLIGIATALRNDPSLRYELLSSVSGVDYLGASRLHSVYHFTSMTYRRRVRVEVAVGIDDPHVPSLTGLYPGAPTGRSARPTTCSASSTTATRR